MTAAQNEEAHRLAHRVVGWMESRPVMFQGQAVALVQAAILEGMEWQAALAQQEKAKADG